MGRATPFLPGTFSLGVSICSLPLIPAFEAPGDAPLVLAKLLAFGTRAVLRRPGFGRRPGHLSLLEHAPLAAARPPVPIAQDPHRGRDEEDADNGRIHEDGDGKPQADGFGRGDAGEGERAGDDDNNGGRGGNYAGGRYEALGDASGVRFAMLVGLADTREQEDLVIHRDPKDRAEHQDRYRRIYKTQRREAEETGEVAVLKHPDHRPEARGQAEDVNDHGLKKDEAGAEGEKEDQVGNAEHEGDRKRGVPVQVRDKVPLPGREPADEETYVFGWFDRPYLSHRVPRLLGVWVALRGCPKEDPVPRRVVLQSALHLLGAPNLRQREHIRDAFGGHIAVAGDTLRQLGELRSERTGLFTGLA